MKINEQIVDVPDVDIKTVSLDVIYKSNFEKNEFKVVRPYWTIRRNIFGHRNIIIKINDYDKIVKTTKIMFYNEDGTKNNFVMGKKYDIFIRSNKIYEGIMSENNIYPIENIPFNLLLGNTIIVIIYDAYMYGDVINKNIKIKIVNDLIENDKYFNTILNKINTVPLKKNMNHEEYKEHMESKIYNIPWKLNFNDNEFNSELKFLNGFVSAPVSKSLLHEINNEFIDNYKKYSKIVHRDNFKIFHINYLYENNNYNELIHTVNIDPNFNCLDLEAKYWLICSDIFSTDPDSKLFNESIVMQTYKEILEISNSIATYIFKYAIDAISSVEILSKCKINKIVIETTFPAKIEEINVDFKETDTGYKIADVDINNHFVKIGFEAVLKFYFEDSTLEFVWIKSTVCHYGTTIRRTAMKNLGKVINIDKLLK